VVVRCGSPSKQEVALTFDDGPTGKHTPRVLAILKQHKVQATFFVLGGMAKRNPALLKRIVDEGHLVASHSYTHPKRGTIEAWREELRRTDEAIRAGGVTPSPYFRPPHGTVTAAVRQVCAERRETIVLYTLLSSDWTRPGKDALVRQVVGGLAPGGIVVLHDGGGERGQTVAALPEIIQGLRKKGLEPVRLDTLLGSTPRAESCARPQR
jgi:peptidoglycan/xylan/chitin deacetylase (PgdA/CDA1 family)